MNDVNYNRFNTLQAYAVHSTDGGQVSPVKDHMQWLVHVTPLVRWAAALAIPCAFIYGVWESKAVWETLTQPLWPYLSFLPLLLLTALADLLCFNYPWFVSKANLYMNSAWRNGHHLVLECSLLSLAIACTWASGLAWYRVWTVMHGGSALSIATLGLMILLAFYVAVVTQSHRAALEEESPEQYDESDLYQATGQDARTGTTAPVREDSIDESSFFDWSHPVKGLDSLAGMVDLKQTLREALAGCRGIAQGVVAERNGFLLSGPPGNGKTTVAACIAAELRLPFVKVGAADLTSKWVNESPQRIKALFRQAARQPCVVFFDEFDGVAQSRGNGQQHGEDRKVVNTLLAQIDSARNLPMVLIAATNFVEQLDPAIVRDGRFDFRIEIPLPDMAARLGILRDQLNQLNVLAPMPVLEHVALLWERRPVSFIRSCLLHVRDRLRARNAYIAGIDDFKNAARAVSKKASALPPPGPRLREIVLTTDVKQQVESLSYRLQNWESIAQRGGDAPTGVVLYGPPGTGKTHLVQALARELDWHLFEVRGSVVVRDPDQLRATVELAYAHRPAIVFMDEADELLADRRRSISPGVTNEILKVMDGAGAKVPEVLFIAATNRLESIDPAALRPGRFGEKIFMGPLKGDELQAFLVQEFRSKSRVEFAADLTPESLSQTLGQATPAYAVAVLRMAVNCSLSCPTNVAVGMSHVRAAIQSMEST